ncbi:DUF4190 domain-containing protein [Thermomonas sp. HDW16]|uniref:DUF4190 domain-containing protein n=1 Tax=Thermomonas sp. HDW16 TaxID=2714945 RepID=UPI001407F67F|nr:DUF4190 domain-containing protein [Thermomonas sp. HDW16]QIL20958.1 DUF4190 domain-containing protein [Thermomonas sp. HDW16]
MNANIRQTSTLAILSLISGVLGWSLLPFLGSIGAVILGHLARSEIRREPDRLDGDGLAVAGLVLGYLSIALGVLFVAAIFLFFGGLVWFAAMFGQ